VIRAARGRLEIWLFAAALARLAAPTPALAGVACVGDCDGDGRVAIEELITGVNIALGNLDLSVCPAFAPDASIAILVRAVNNALDGCASAPTATPMAPTATPTATLPPGDPTGAFLSSVLPRMLDIYRSGLAIPPGTDGQTFQCGAAGEATVTCAAIGDGNRWTVELSACSGGFEGVDPGDLDGTMSVDAFDDCATESPSGVVQVVYLGSLAFDGVSLDLETTISGVRNIERRLQVLAAGSATGDCLGGERFVSSTTLLVEADASCPSFGILQISPDEDFVEGAFDRVTFSDDGFEVDRDADGTVDETYTGCDDPRLAACAGR